MREIKFKAGPKQPSGKIYWDSFKLKENNTGAIKEQYFEKQYDTKWLQFTEIKDRFGNEICEGDILKFTSVNQVNYEDGDYIGFVKFSEGCFWLMFNKNKPSPNNVLGFPLYHHKFLKIIGNIYENKELIKNRGVI